MHAVRFENVSKSYPIYDSPGDRLKELVTFNRLEFHQNFWALHDVNFEVARGETFCIIGENGSGKSTLLQLVAGILQPSSGAIRVDGRVSAVLELGAHGITILFVSHAMADVKALGDRALWLEKGRVIEMGETDRVVSKYM